MCHVGVVLVDSLDQISMGSNFGDFGDSDITPKHQLIHDLLSSYMQMLLPSFLPMTVKLPWEMVVLLLISSFPNACSS